MSTLVCTFDLEPWWVVIPPVVSRADWQFLPDRSAEPLARFLDLCDETGTRATFFVVGEYARQFPKRIRTIAERGHEVGCHSLFHDDLAQQPLSDFLGETREAKDIIEDAAGAPIASFRAPSFSVPVGRLREFFEALSSLGFRIDSSLSSAARVYGGVQGMGYIGRVFALDELVGVPMFEVGVPGLPVLGKELTVFGGGYLRITPTSVALAALKRRNYDVLYLHAHDFDADVPRIPGAGVASHFRRKLRVGDLYSRVRRMLEMRPGISCQDAVAQLTGSGSAP